MKKYSLAMLLVLAGGCNTHNLEKRWLPLEQLVERPGVPFVGDGVLTTTGPTVWVKDLEEFLKEWPPGSVNFEAVMLHEQAHAVRQGDLPGRLSWEASYLTDSSFRWKEEKIGWWFEIRHQVENGQEVYVANLAGTLSDKYKTPNGTGMVEYEEAVEWINEVIAGRWYPPAKVINTIRKAHAEK